MGYVIDLLMNKKYYESIDEVENYLVAQGADKNSVVQSLVFSKDIFPSKEDASLWAREHGFTSIDNDATNDDTYFILDQLDASEFVETSLKTIDITTGVQAIVGLLKQDVVSADYLSLRNNYLSGIKFSDSLPHIIEAARVVKGYHASYGEVEITKEMLLSFAENFKKQVVGIDLMIDYDHDQAEAAGWIKSVYLSPDQTILYAEVKWTPKGAQCLSDRSFRYFSPEFVRNYTHPHTGVSHGPTFLGGGLVNRPFLKMEAIVSMKEKGVFDVDTIKLDEHKSIVSKFEAQLNELKLSEENAKKIIAGLKDETVVLGEKVKSLESEKTEKERIEKNERLFSENKINKAQLDALNSGKDLYEILALSEKMNAAPKGANGTNEDAITLSESELKACEALGISKEDFVKYNR